MKVDDRKVVEAIKQMKATKDKKALQSFQGMVNYLKRYSSKLTRLFEPLQPLSREETEWTWDYSHQDAFDAIKEELSRTPVLALFDRKAEHVIQTDASMKGLCRIAAIRKTSDLRIQNSHSRQGTLLQHPEGIAKNGIRHGEASQLCVW